MSLARMNSVYSSVTASRMTTAMKQVHLIEVGRVFFNSRERRGVDRRAVQRDLARTHQCGGWSKYHQAIPSVSATYGPNTPAMPGGTIRTSLPFSATY